jgi:hypothetical protein
MRRAIRLIMALGLLTAGLLIGQSGAVASPSGALAIAAPGTCPKPATYPPTPGATVRSSTTSPFLGQTIEVSGTNYCPDEDVDIRIGGQHVGTAHTDASGNFDPPVVVPGPAGSRVLDGIGASGLSNDRDSLTLCVTGDAVCSGTGGTTAPSSGGGLPFTGTQVTGLIVLAIVLLGGGGAAIYAGRRKRASHTS